MKNIILSISVLALGIACLQLLHRIKVLEDKMNFDSDKLIHEYVMDHNNLEGLMYQLKFSTSRWDHKDSDFKKQK